jgi:hypothetical protein
MPYGPWDEYFIHQLPRPLDHVNDTEKSWSDRCYFNAHSEDGTILLVTGYGNNPNTQTAHGYAKLSLADGRHWDLDAGRRCTTDRGDLFAGPLRWTCVEPLKRWKLELGPNDSNVEWELNYESRAPMWELLPITIRKRGRVIVDMTHIKQPARYTGWIRVDGEQISVDGFTGGRDRTFGLRASEEVDFWLWFEAVFEDRAIEAWVFESSDGAVQYIDGGFTFNDGRLSKRFVSFQHEVTFDGDRKRPVHADIVFVDEDGETFRVTAHAKHPDVNANYGTGLSRRQTRDGFSYYSWNSTDSAELAEVESNAVSIDQLMDFEMDGMTGHGIFEILARGDHYQRYPNWGTSPPRNSTEKE